MPERPKLFGREKYIMWETAGKSSFCTYSHVDTDIRPPWTPRAGGRKDLILSNNQTILLRAQISKQSPSPPPRCDCGCDSCLSLLSVSLDGQAGRLLVGGLGCFPLLGWMGRWPVSICACLERYTSMGASRCAYPSSASHAFLQRPRLCRVASRSRSWNCPSSVRWEAVVSTLVQVLTGKT